MPSPWLILGVMIALGTAWVAGDHHGTVGAEEKCTLASQAMQIDYGVKLKAAEDAKVSAEHAFNDLKDKTDGEHEHDKAEIKAGVDRTNAAIANGLRIAKSCNIGAVGAVPGNSQPVSGDGGGAAPEFYLLPGSSPGRLSARYAEADNYLSLYRGCRTRLLDAIEKSRAPR